MSGRIGLVVFQLVVGNLEFGPDLAMRPAAFFIRTIVGDLAERFIAAGVIIVAPIGVGLAATGCGWIVRLHQVFVPLAYDLIGGRPLAFVVRASANIPEKQRGHEAEDQAEANRAD